MLFVFIAIIQFGRLRNFVSPTGADGFFYLKQIQSLSEQGLFYYKDYSLAFGLPSLLNWIFKDPLLSYQIAASISYGGIAWISWRLLQHLSPIPSRRQLILGQLIFLTFLLFNNYYFELNFVFLKSAWALLFFLMGLDFYIQGKFKWMGFFYVLALLSHQIMLGFLLLFAAFHFRPKSPRWIWFGGLSILVGALLIQIFHPRLFLHAVHLFRGLNYQKFNLLQIERQPEIYLEMLGLTLIAIFLLRFKKITLYFFSFIIALPILFPDAISTNTVSYRWLLLATPLAAIALIIILLFNSSQRRWLQFTLVLGLFAIHIHWLRPLTSWINPWPARIQRGDEIAKIIPADSLLYAPHGLEFYLAFITPFRPRSLLQQNPPQETYRIAYVKPYLESKSTLKADLEQLTLLKLSEDYWLYSEKIWQSLNQIHGFFPHPTNLLDPKPEFVANY